MGTIPGDLRLATWQHRIFASAWITYFAYYLCRFNMPMAKTRMSEAFSWDAGAIGIVFSSLTIMYALGQFVNGQLADRYGARRIASIGVLGSVLANLTVFVVTLVAGPGVLGPRTALILIAVLWGANGFFQSMGWSPIVRLMAHWFPAERRGNVMGLLGTSYQLGGAFSWFLAFMLTGYYVKALGGDWRSVFLVPAVLFALVGILFFLLVRDDPTAAGLESGSSDSEFSREPESATAALAGEGTVAGTLFQNVLRTLSNPYLWVVAFTFLLLDVNRYGFVNWLPAFLEERGGIGSSTLMANFQEVMKRCIHPLAGSLGAITAGWATDRFFGGRRAPVIAMLLALLGLFTMLFAWIDPHRSWCVFLVVAGAGFCTYGPHILMVGHAAQDFGRKSGAAGAAGFIDAMGYLGATLAGWGAGELITARGYETAFVAFGAAPILGALLISVLWKVRPRH